MTQHFDKEAAKLIYMPTVKPTKPEYDEETMELSEYEQLLSEYEKELLEWEIEHGEAELMKLKADDPTDGPGPAESSVVSEENPVWENPLYFGDNGPGPKV